ncbi:CDP-alcohol phosphatidyltransferase family protein [Micromonospora sp. NPDC051141]|uniref:CDP-alcohol phosphatidyltransferase family protein n=1 Tax=Micromonospora sp. NPDC051141 TaxID=3364284 RepID=UPI0037A49C7C
MAGASRRRCRPGEGGLARGRPTAAAPLDAPGRNPPPGREPRSRWPATVAYRVGDVADGRTARRMSQETRHGAVFDIVADRVSSVAVILAPTEARPSMAVPSCHFSCSSTCWTACAVSDSCTGRS